MIRHGRLLVLMLTAVFGATMAWATEPPGRVLCSYWRELPGNLVSDLTSANTFPLYPSEQVYLEKLEIPENQEGNFGTVLRGFLHAPASGEYSFYIASTNQGELWLSPNDRPEDKTLVAKVSQWCAPQDWTAAPEQQSKPIRLDRDARYYFEVRHKNGGGDNHLSVAWKLPDGTIEGPIPGSRLSPGHAVVVPPPRATLGPVPTIPGKHLLQVEVDYLMQRITVPVNVVLPRGYREKSRSPAIIFLADPDLARDPQSARARPDRLMPAGYAESKQVIVVSPQCPEGRSYEQQVTMEAIGAATGAVCDAYSLDPKHLGLTGVAGGGTACWRIALVMPKPFFAISPVCGLEVNDPRLREALQGTLVRIYTDIGEGFATGRANEMAKLLEPLQPKPQVVYLGEKELAGLPAQAYCYARADFYDDLLGLAEPLQEPRSLGYAAIVLLAAAPLVLVGALWVLHRLRKRSLRSL